MHWGDLLCAPAHLNGIYLSNFIAFKYLLFLQVNKLNTWIIYILYETILLINLYGMFLFGLLDVLFLILELISIGGKY